MDDALASGKRTILEKLLDEGMVLVTLDSRVEGVVVPDHLVGDPQLRLNLSYRFGRPMDVDDDGVDATLSFGGQPFTCRLPWGAIYLLISHATGQPFLFPGEVPVDLRAELDDALQSSPEPKPADVRRGRPARAPASAGVAPPPAPSPDLRVIAGESDGRGHEGEGQGEGEDKNGSAEGSDSPARPRGSHLRVVK